LTIYTDVRMLVRVARRRFNFYIDDEQREGLRAIKENVGILESEQVRRAIDAWLEKNGLAKRPERKRAGTRKRS
jgi:hypothetical protein